MNIIMWLLEFLLCWVICVLVVTNLDPFVTRVSAWIDLKILKRETTGSLTPTTVESRVDDERILRR